MKAKKVNEMIDPYTSETNNIDLDTSYTNIQHEKWFQKYAPEVEYEITDKGVVIYDDLELDSINDIIIFPFEEIEARNNASLYLQNLPNLETLPKKVICENSFIISDCPKIKELPEVIWIEYEFTLYQSSFNDYKFKIPENADYNLGVEIHFWNKHKRKNPLFSYLLSKGYTINDDDDEDGEIILE